MQAPAVLPFSTIIIVGALSVFGSMFDGPEASEQVEIIDNSPFSDVNDPIKAKLESIRPLTSGGFAQASELPKMRFSAPLIIESATQFPEILRFLADAGLRPEDVTLEQLKQILLESNYANDYLWNPQDSPETFSSPKVAISEIATAPSFKIWDATTVTSMFATGVLDVNDVSFVNTPQGVVETIGFDGDYGTKIEDVYRRLPLIATSRQQRCRAICSYFKMECVSTTH